MKLLLSKPDSLGDQFIAAGAVQALRRLRPDWQVVWHVRTGLEVIAPVFGAEVFTPQTMNAPQAEAARLAAHVAPLLILPYPLSPHEPWTDAVRHRVNWWAAFLRATAWDATALALVNRNWVGDLTVAIAPAPVRVGFAANAAQQPLVNEAQALAGSNAPAFTITLTPSFTRPEAAQIRDLLATLEPRLREFEPPPVWQPLVRSPGFSRNPAGETPSAVAQRAMADKEGGTTSNVRPLAARILIAPGVGGDPRRAWGLKNFLKVADVLRARGASVTWLEGPDDAPFLDGLPADEAHPRLRIGRNDLPRLVEQLGEIDLLICHDTAYVHLAAGTGVPTVAIYGAGQHGRFHPNAGRVKIVVSQIACAGCQWHCLWDRLVCVADIPVEAVARAAEQMLAGDAAPVTVNLATPVASAPEGESASLQRRLQEEVLTLDADRFARLQIIQSLLAMAQGRSLLAGDGRPGAHESPASRLLPAEPRISVIVPMGRADRVAPTLASFATQQGTPAHWQIVLVGVEAESVARAHPHLPIAPVRLAAHQLPPRTRCLGVERATGDWFLFVDDDIELSADCFSRITEFLGHAAFAADAPHPVGAVGFRLPGKSGRFFERLTDISNFWAQQDDQAGERDWLYSAAFLVRAEAYRASGGFNPDLPNGEDVDLTRRIAAAGYRLRYEPTLVARHDHRRDTLTAMWRYFWRNGNAARYFFAAHGGACPFSLKTVWLKSWSDLRMNLAFQRQRSLALGMRAPLVWLNYLIVEASLEWHWQEYLHEGGRYRELPARARSDVTFVEALAAWDEGRSLRGGLRYALAVLQDFANPVRR